MLNYEDPITFIESKIYQLNTLNEFGINVNCKNTEIIGNNTKDLQKFKKEIIFFIMFLIRLFRSKTNMFIYITLVPIFL